MATDEQIRLARKAVETLPFVNAESPTYWEDSQNMAEAVRALCDEVERLREGLERIEHGDVPGVTFADDDLVSQFAAEVLRGGSEA